MISNDDLLAKLKEQAKFANLVKNGICECCGEINPYALKVFENHHISTVGFSSETCLLCLNCHAVETQLQNGIPPKFRSKQMDLKYRIPYVFLSHSALRSRMAETELQLLNQFYTEANRWKEWL
ncbi:hypothetical protein [Methanosarcina sp. UBA411]|jgi:hypothetical protein|uniref:hypothetical protein n=1 Tax=Methanosarcina sp. UBA411 TaxID=1915589 RepID=UPI0025F20C8E|nr:hypothetical protein [Methanosarcina sp. UBA411]